VGSIADGPASRVTVAKAEPSLRLNPSPDVEVPLAIVDTGKALW